MLRTACLALILLSLTACSSLSEAELFKKKQECAEYKEQIEEDLSEFRWDESLDEIFYSPKLNTCLFTTSWTSLAFDSAARSCEDVLSGAKILYVLVVNYKYEGADKYVEIERNGRKTTEGDKYGKNVDLSLIDTIFEELLVEYR